MRIVFDARLHFPVVSGMSRYIVNLLNHLLAIDNENQYIILVNGQLPESDELFFLQKYSNITFKKIALHHMGIVNYTKMPAIIRELNPDIYHYPHLDAPIVKGIKTIATIHDSNLSGNIKKFDDPFGIKTRYFKKTLANTLKKAASVIFISNAAKTEILNDYIDAKNPKFKLVYNGFDSKFGEIIEQTVIDVKNKFHLEKPFLLYVGQIRSHKNIRRMVQSFIKTNSNWEFILVGHNYMKIDFSKYPKNVRYLSIVSENELKGLYYHSKAFVFPSFIEGFGFPVLESLSFGKPIIGTNYGAIAEIGNGFLIGVDPKDENDIAAKMSQFMSHSESELNLVDCQNYIQKFSWETCAEEVLAIYKETYFGIK